MVSASSVLYQSIEGVGLLTLNDPADGNRLNQDRISLIRSHLETAVQDESIRVILLRGKAPGKPWCLGMDLDVLAKNLDAASLELRRKSVQSYNDLLEAISTSPKPVIGLIGGPVKAGGTGLAAACDILLCTQDAEFELTEVLFGLIPANVMPWLLGRRMGMQRVRYLMLSASPINAGTALAWGLADEVHETAEAEKAIRRLLKGMLRSEPGALAEVKKFSQTLMDSAPENMRRLAEDKLVELMGRKELAHALEAFGSGSAPSWFGRFKSKESLFFQEYGDE